MATIIIPRFESEKTEIGLNTYQYTILTAGDHVARMRVSRHPSSTLTMQILLNGSPVKSMTLTPVAVGGGQIEQSLIADIICAVNDTVAFALSSSNPTDLQLNTIKSSLSLYRGSGN